MFPCVYRAISMKILIKSLLLVVATTLASTTFAGSLDGPEIADFRVWRSTRCYKPLPPPLEVSDARSYNLTVDAFNKYFGQMKTFMECVGSEGNQDYEAMRKVLENGMGQSRAEALQDLERTRAAIESYRAKYFTQEKGPLVEPQR